MQQFADSKVAVEFSTAPGWVFSIGTTAITIIVNIIGVFCDTLRGYYHICRQLVHDNIGYYFFLKSA